MLEFLPTHLADPAATDLLGESLGKAALAGGVIALVGDLGSGKTTMAQGIVRSLGYQNEVTSPTFSLVQEYRGGRLDIFHFDFYRVESDHELLDLGWDDYLEQGGLVIVEWPALFPHLLPEGTIWIQLTHENDGRLAKIIPAPCG